MHTIRWVGAKPIGLTIYAWKKNAPRLSPGLTLVRVQFPFEVGYIVRDLNGLVECQDRWCPTFEAWLKTPGHVIGMRDMQAAAGLNWEEEWRSAYGNQALAVVAEYRPPQWSYKP